MSDLFKKTFRGYLIDHHSPDPPTITFDKLNTEEYLLFFKEAHINNLMLYCKDHWGVTYYDTKIGKRHPGLRDRDWIKELRPILKENNIEFNAYYCLEYDNHAPKTWPEWRLLKADGSPLRCQYSRAQWHMPCYQSEYRNYVLQQLKEIITNYSPDSLFLDIFGKSLCYCPNCLELFKQRHPKEKYNDLFIDGLPKSEEELLKHNKIINKFLDDLAYEMLKEIVTNLKQIDPQLAITINFAALYPKRIRDLLDYQFTEPWAGNWLSAAYARDTAINQYPQLGPGDVSEVYNYRSENIYKLAAAEIVAQGCRSFIYSGSQHPDGTLEHEEAKRIGSAYAEVKKFEEYLTDRQVIADIGIIQSDLADLLRSPQTLSVNAIARVKKGSLHRDALLGAMKLCDYSKYSWNIIPEQQATCNYIRSRGYKVLILPDVYHVSDQLAATLKEFVVNGGTLITAGESGLLDESGNNYKDNDFHPTIKELLSISFIGIEDKFAQSEWGAYLKILNPNDEIWRYTPSQTFPPVSSIHYKIKINSDINSSGDQSKNKNQKVLATFIDPVTEVTSEKWVNWWSPPPAVCEINMHNSAHDNAAAAAIVENKFGQGRTIYSAFNLFSMENKNFHLLDNIFKGILDKHLNFKLRLVTSSPHIVGIVSYERKDQIIVHLLSHLASRCNGDAPYIEAGTLEVSFQWRKIKKVSLVYPQKNNLNFELTKDEIYNITLPNFNLHQIVIIE
ncbi:MAG: beta-galactosidase trimerization domain-containing protein [Oligoflexia bacterium]|nr:beta-galactosidase trimerization domain-containing protein [Oligoflexia bacterium]